MKSIIVTLLFFVNFGALSAQVCSGNLGENIFERGDFGSGLAPVLATNPNIAPGYSYTTSVPSDGFYTICSNTGALAGLYPTWIVAGDNSNSPNGYMMVVNASYAPGDFYEEVVDGLCENTLYEFSADILNLIRIGTPNHIDPNVSFLIDGVEVYSTGDIEKSERWKQYGFSFTTDNTQTSVTLTLRNNAPGGGGNDLALDNISFRPCGPSSFIGIESDTTIFLCIDDDPLTVVADIEAAEGQNFSILWQSSTDALNWVTLEDSVNNTITHTNFNPGDYYYRYLSAGNPVNILNEKCRIISDEIKLTILPDTYEITDTLCEGVIYNFGNQQLSVSGIYTENFESQYGCDSTVFLDLVFVPSLAMDFQVNANAPSCFGFDDGSIIVNSISGGYGDIEYLIQDDENSELGIEVPSGEYVIIAEDRYQCTSSYSIFLFDPPEIDVELGLDTSLRLGDEFAIDVSYSTLFESFNWNGDGVFSCQNCEDPLFVPYNSGSIVILVEDDKGCQATDSMYVEVSDEAFIYLPNVFSPNGDNVNDFFTINYYGRSLSTVSDFRVFDRWGGLIYEIKNRNIESGGALWDGYIKSKQVETGVFYYIFEAVLINGVVFEKKGDITVFK
ncbi:MAG: gliding motility-associated C-terminal domain-containing protein [Saprospiraceae bacterium]|nr:gliding motility-associated C-terminal domain-containing protein [Saprospiraceae bacterium]